MTNDKTIILEQLRVFFQSLGCQTTIQREDDRHFIYINEQYEIGFFDNGDLYSGVWKLTEKFANDPFDSEFIAYNEKNYTCAAVNIANKIVSEFALNMTQEVANQYGQAGAPC